MEAVMYGKKYRAQILLEPEQYEKLSALAASQQRSVSDLVREIVAVYLAGDGTPEADAVRTLLQIREIVAGYDAKENDERKGEDGQGAQRFMAGLPGSRVGPGAGRLAVAACAQ